MNERRLQLLVSPGFVVGLSVLLLNDFVFKQQFHNGFTGKLSDFAGLFILPLFWTALFPRLNCSIYIVTAILFLFWKSVYSQPLIESWNRLPFFLIARTVDYSDLFCLVCLPLSFVYSRRASSIPARRSVMYLFVVISLFAFTATSYSTKTAYDNEYQFRSSRTELIERMSHLPLHDVHTSFGESDTFEISFDSCTGKAIITLREKDNQSFIVLKEINYRCPSGGDKQEMLEYFEKEFINKLREEPVTRSSQVQYIWSLPPNKRLQPTP